jgi:hypothetical protein
VLKRQGTSRLLSERLVLTPRARRAATASPGAELRFHVCVLVRRVRFLGVHLLFAWMFSWLGMGDWLGRFDRP